MSRRRPTGVGMCMYIHAAFNSKNPVVPLVRGFLILYSMVATKKRKSERKGWRKSKSDPMTPIYLSTYAAFRSQANIWED